MMKENYGIDVPLDFNYYPRGQWDNQDAVINEWRIDVKGTRKGGQWMLIEWNKLNFRQRDNNLSHLYAMFTVDWDRSKDQPTGRASYKGAVSLNKLKAGCPTTVILVHFLYPAFFRTPVLVMEAFQPLQFNGILCISTNQRYDCFMDIRLRHTLAGTVEA